MSINNTNIPGINPGNIDSLTQPRAGDTNSVNSTLADNFEWFNIGDGKALPISAQSQFSSDSTMDQMVSTMLGHLGLA